MARKDVVLAKLSRPRVHDALVRTRLHEALGQACRKPVVWLSAQPGAGKTTLVADHLDATKRPALWYQADAGDGDAATFVYHLRLGARAIAGAKRADRLPLLTPEYLADLAGFARRFFRDLYALLGDGAILVLDNFQEVAEESAFHRIVAEGLAEIPEGINAIVLSRVDPPAPYATLLAAGAIALIDGTELRLTRDETESIARQRGVSGDAAVAAIHERANGWAAGLVLLLTHARAADAPHDDDESLQHVFGYFAQRVFDDSPPEHRQALMQLAFLPQITVGVAEALTGMPDVGRLLERYYKRHLFTDRRRIAVAPAVDAVSSALVVYQFHALFRTFLRHQARATFDDGALRDIASRAGSLLVAAGSWEQGLALFAEAGAWDAYAAKLVVQVEGLLAQGRRETAVEWLRRIPAAVRAARPWLAYWEARALMATSPDLALRILDDARRRFAGSGDAAGELACGAAAVQTLWYARLGWSEIAHRVDDLEPLLGAQPAFPSAGVELLTYSAVHAALSFCRPGHPAVAGMAERLLGLVDDVSIDWNQRLSTATHLITYFHNAVAHELVLRLMTKVDGPVETLPASALHRAFWFVFRAMHDLRQADHAAAAAAFQRAEDLAREEGLLHAEFAAMQFHTYLDLTFRKEREAEARLARLERHPSRLSPDGAMNYRVAKTMLAQLKGDVGSAKAHAEEGLAAVDRIGAAYFQAVFPVLFVSALADAGETDRALAIVAESRRLSAGSYLEVMEVQLVCEEAYIALVRGEQALALERLRRGLETAAAAPTRAAYIHRVVTKKPALLALALENGIQPDFVRELIRRWSVPPPEHEVAGWPWPIEVRTLGRFDVRVDGAPIEFGRKTPKKTLALLKAVIARGGSAPEGALLDALWPDEDGDAAARSLAAAVHRLRGLLGVGEAVVQNGGRIALDGARVWVDAFAFERALAGTHTAPRDAAAAAALALYRGPFLVEEEGETWPVATRERLRSKFIQGVSTHAAGLEAEHRPEEAIAWYLRGLEADDVVEPFYQGLMRCYHRLDRLPEAVSAYRRLKQTLSVTLSLPPSAGTERLYQTLRLG